jgi:hypothetical protein
MGTWRMGTGTIVHGEWGQAQLWRMGTGTIVHGEWGQAQLIFLQRMGTGTINFPLEASRDYASSGQDQIA